MRTRLAMLSPVLTIALPRERADAFSRDFGDFGELVMQRQHSLMQKSMHQLAMAQAIAKHKDELGELGWHGRTAPQSLTARWVRTPSPVGAPGGKLAFPTRPGRR